MKTFAVVENGSSHIPKPYEVVQHIKTYVAHQANWLSSDGPNFEFHISSVTFFSSKLASTWKPSRKVEHPDLEQIALSRTAAAKALLDG